MAETKLQKVSLQSNDGVNIEVGKSISHWAPAISTGLALCGSTENQLLTPP